MTGTKAKTFRLPREAAVLLDRTVPPRSGASQARYLAALVSDRALDVRVSLARLEAAGFTPGMLLAADEALAGIVGRFGGDLDLVARELAEAERSMGLVQRWDLVPEAWMVAVGELDDPLTAQALLTVVRDLAAGNVELRGRLTEDLT
jgi:hypothetical protein